MVVEIPHGSFTKFEIDKKTGLVMVDRFQSMPVAYPANYGSVCSTLAGDGDNLDALVYTREPLPPGTMIRVRIVGVLRSTDGGEQDDKLISVPTSEIDPTYDSITDIEDLPAMERERLASFFRVYKQIPEGRKKVEVGQFQGRREALDILQLAMDAYKKKPKKTLSQGEVDRSRGPQSAARVGFHPMAGSETDQVPSSILPANRYLVEAVSATRSYQRWLLVTLWRMTLA